MCECVVKWFILTVQTCVRIEMGGDNAFVNVCQCASGMNLCEMHLSHMCVRMWVFWIVKYPKGKLPRTPTVYPQRESPFFPVSLAGNYMEVKGVFLVKRLYKPRQGLVLAYNMCHNNFPKR